MKIAFDSLLFLSIESFSFPSSLSFLSLSSSFAILASTSIAFFSTVAFVCIAIVRVFYIFILPIFSILRTLSQSESVDDASGFARGELRVTFVGVDSWDICYVAIEGETIRAGNGEDWMVLCRSSSVVFPVKRNRCGSRSFEDWYPKLPFGFRVEKNGKCLENEFLEKEVQYLSTLRVGNLESKVLRFSVLVVDLDRTLT